MIGFFFTCFIKGEEMSFKSDFIWGAATSSFQIEGAYNEDGKSLSIWDVMCEKPGAVFDSHTGKIACDHYHRYKEDVQLMKDIGLQAYRFSISWPRIFPSGTGKINSKGMDFYKKLCDNLLENNITPFATLYHWDLPYELYTKGGFLNRDSADWFAEYAAAVTKELGDRVQNYFTINEPQCIQYLGYGSGEHAPGLKTGLRDLLLIGHNLLLSHGKAVQAIRANGNSSVQVGWAPTCSGLYPATETAEDIAATEMAQFDVTTECNGTQFNSFGLTYFNDPVYFGKYPDKMFTLFGEYMPKIEQEDMKTISQKVDFHGHNLYNGVAIKSDGEGGYLYCKRDIGYSHTSLNWPVTPECIRWLPKNIAKRYGVPIYITENGLSNQDWIALDGKVHDSTRIDFLHRYFIQMKKAVEEGAPIKGYFQWSLLDNFEWRNGYNERFGLIHVDYKTQKRTLKDSALWYSDVIKSNGDNL